MIYFIESGQRLGKTLLQLARKLGQKDPRSIRIEHKMSHEELATMIRNDVAPDRRVYAEVSAAWID